MALSPQRQDALLQDALQRLKFAFRDAIDKTLDDLAPSAPTPPTGASREDATAGHHELSRKQSGLVMAFNESVDDAVATELRRRRAATAAAAPKTAISDWQTLSLVDDRELDLQVKADAMGNVLRQMCDANISKLDGYVMAALPASDRPESDRNPLRPELMAKAVVFSVDSICKDASIAAILVSFLEDALLQRMPAVYQDIVEAFQAAGVQPASMSVRQVRGPGTEFGGFADSSSKVADKTLAPAASNAGGAGSHSTHAASGGAVAGAGNSAGGQGAAVAAPRGTVMGQVDQDVMALIRRLAVSGPAGGVVDQHANDLDARVSGPGGMVTSVGSLGLPNIIAAHREELRSATTSALDHMVIDVVGSLFDQILSDAKVPPQMARHLARLQLPVLRAALGDKTFFSSRKHPVRRFVNRIASLAVAFDDFTEDSAQEFLRLVRELVDEIVAGDFDQIEPYEEKLDRMETFIAAHVQRELEANHQAGSMLNQREVDLLQHQRYTQQMHGALAAVPMDDFLRNFLTQVWSQAIVHSHRVHGEEADITQRMRAVGRELVLSVQSKATPLDRKNFLLRLPHLMKDLNEGLAMIGWPEKAKKAFLGDLLPAHSDSLKGAKSSTQLDFNLLARQMDKIMALQVPKPGEGPVHGTPMPPVEDVIAPVFTDEELRRVGLLQEGAVDWDGAVDIDLSAEPDVAEADLNIQGLPTSTDPIEPMQGASLADNVQIGFTYRMNFERAWHKVRLSHISPGRTFFVFTRGKENSEAISMTSRMLHRLCDTGRLRAYENAYLLERATARARKQLAGLNTRSGASLM